jgi:hypothetical protein
MAQRAAITVDVGASAPIEVIRQTIDDFDSVCQFSGSLQYQAAIAEAEVAIIRRPTAWISGPAYDDYVLNVERFFPPFGRGGVGVPAAILAPALSRYLEQYNVSRETTTTVESIRYSNPLEIIFGIGVVGLLVLQTVRDWSGRRRLNTAVAAEFENTMYARKIFRDELQRRLLEGSIPITPQLLNELLSIDVARSMEALGNSQFTLRELESAENEDHTKPDE